MNKRALKVALCLGTVITSFAAAPALAQEESTLDTVVVTARRMEERLQDVPISITVFNQQQLDRRNVSSGQDLATYTPSLTANPRFGANNVTFSIRGFTQELRTTASVATYFADVVAPRGGNGGQPAGDGGGPGSFFDLQNVQVLKGPQGTLFGRNTTGGAVLLVPQKPSRDFEGYIEGSLGNYDMRRLQGVVNLPINDAMRLRVSYDQQKREGYLENISAIGPRKFGDQNYKAVRVSFVADLTDNLENYTIASYGESHNYGPIAKLTQCSTSATQPAGTFPFGLLACQQLQRQAGLGFYTVQNLAPDPLSRNESMQVINTTTWHVNDNLTVKNIASYSRLRNIIRAESFGTDFVIPSQLGPVPNTGAAAGQAIGFARSVNAPGFNSADQKNYTEELQFQGRMNDDRLIWQLGGYYEESEPIHPSGAQSPLFLACTNSNAFQCSDPIAPLIGRAVAGSINYAVGEVTLRNYAIYGQATYKLNEQLKLTGGLRYTWDDTVGSARLLTYRFPTPNVPVAVCTLAVPQVAITDPNACFTRSTQKSRAPTWLIDLDYNPTQDVLVYAKYARGYRQGAVNYNAPLDFQTFGPEKVNTYEVGAKTSWRGAIPGSLNSAAFYNDFSNQQLALGLISSTNAATPTQAIVNGGKSRIYGLEFDGTVSPVRGLNIEASYAYLNTKLKSLTVPTAAVGPYDIFQFAALPGTPLAFTPKHKASVTASYRLPLPDNVGAITASATYTYASKYIVTTGTVGTLPSLSLLNLSLDWRGLYGKPVDLQLFATNVTNEKYYVGVNDQRTSGFVSQQTGTPRMVGARLRYRFGANAS